MLPLVLALPALIEVAGKLIGTLDHPAAKVAQSAIAEVSTAITKKEIAPEQLDAANQHIETMAQMLADQQTAEQGQNADTQRVEVNSEDPYVRRMRPTFGYAMAFSWTVQMMAVSWAMIFNPALAVQIIAALSQLTGLWGIALAVLGIYTYGKTQEFRAKVAADPALIQTVPTALGSLVGDAWSAATSKLKR